MANNPFTDKKFLKDIKRSFIPQAIFSKNKYNYNISECKFLLRKNNLVQMNIRLTNGDKFEYTYILGNEFIKENINIAQDKNINIDNDMIIDE